MKKNTIIVRAIAMIASALILATASGCGMEAAFAPGANMPPTHDIEEPAEQPSSENTEPPTTTVLENAATTTVTEYIESAEAAVSTDCRVISAVLREKSDEEPAQSATAVTAAESIDSSPATSATKTVATTTAVEETGMVSFASVERKLITGGETIVVDEVCFTANEPMAITIEKLEDETTVSGKNRDGSDWSFKVLECKRYEELAKQRATKYKLAYTRPCNSSTGIDRWVIATDNVPGTWSESSIGLPVAKQQLEAGDVVEFMGVELTAHEDTEVLFTEYNGIETTITSDDGWKLKLVNASYAYAYESIPCEWQRIATQICKFDFTPIAIFAVGEPPLELDTREELTAQYWLKIEANEVADFKDCISFHAEASNIWRICETSAKIMGTSGDKCFIIVDEEHLNVVEGMQYHLVYRGPNCRDPKWFVFTHGDASVEGTFGATNDYHRSANDLCDLLASRFYGESQTFSSNPVAGADPMSIWDYVSFGGLSYEDGLYKLEVNSVHTDWDLELVWDGGEENFTTNHAVLDYSRAYSTMVKSADTTHVLARMQNEHWLTTIQMTNDEEIQIFVMDKWCENHCVAKTYAAKPLDGSVMLIAETTEWNDLYGRFDPVSHGMAIDYRVLHLMNIVSRDTEFMEFF